MKKLQSGIFLLVLVVLFSGACTPKNTEKPYTPSATPAPALSTTPAPAFTTVSTTSPVLTTATTPAPYITTPPVTATTTPPPPPTTLPPPTTSPVPTTSPDPASTIPTTDPVPTTSPSTTLLPVPQTTTPPPQPDFNSILLSDIQASYLTGAKICASNNVDNVLVPGTVLLYRTNQDRSGKLVILEYGDSLAFKHITYTDDGSIYSQNAKLRVRLGQYCDLDSGKIIENGADFYYQKINTVEKYLVPLVTQIDPEAPKPQAKFGVFNLPVVPPPNLMVKQDIEIMMKTPGYYVYWDKFLVTGDNVTGFLQINPYGGDFTKATWYFQIVDPSGEIERSWFGSGKPLVNTYHNELNFDHAVLKNGFYEIRFVSFGWCVYSLYLNIVPSGWELSNVGISNDSWKIIK